MNPNIRSEKGLRWWAAAGRPAIPAATSTPLVTAPATVACLRPIAPLVASLHAAAIAALRCAAITALRRAAAPLVATAVAALAAAAALVGAIPCIVAAGTALHTWRERWLNQPWDGQPERC